MSSRLNERAHFVAEQIEARGVRDPLLLAAMRAVPREDFVPEDIGDEAYEDYPLPIGEGQTISQPFMVAFMIEALGLAGGEKVLEIGAGSGYASAVLSKIAGSVFAIERIGSLAKRAASRLADLGFSNIHVRHADGIRGWWAEAPFDAILVSAGAVEIPKVLEQQLCIGGHMVVPIGHYSQDQDLIRLTRVGETEFNKESLGPVRFVPLIGGLG